MYAIWGFSASCLSLCEGGKGRSCTTWSISDWRSPWGLSQYVPYGWSAWFESEGRSEERDGLDSGGCAYLAFLGTTVTCTVDFGLALSAHRSPWGPSRYVAFGWSANDTARVYQYDHEFLNSNGHHGVTPDMSHSVGVLDLSNETPQLSSREVYGYDHEFRDWL